VEEPCPLCTSASTYYLENSQKNLDLVCYRILVGNPEEKRPLGRPRRRWVDNIKIELKEIGWDGGDWIDLAQDRDQWRALVRAVMNFRVP
jgi:hypothetical protein